MFHHIFILVWNKNKIMVRKKKNVKSAKKQQKKSKITVGTVAFVSIFLLAFIGLYTPESMKVTMYLILAILGVIVSIFNITAKQEIDFLVSVGALIVILLSWHVFFNLPAITKTFIEYLLVSFGTAGFVIALAVIIQLGYRP